MPEGTPGPTRRLRWGAPLLALSFVAGSAPATAQQRALVPHERLAREIYEEMVGIRTAHPDGNTTTLAEAARARLLAAGFPESDVLVLAPEPTQGNLVATLRGRNPHLKPIVLLAHIDGVAVDPAEWRYPPFELTEAEGHFWGRSTADDKDEAAIHVANLIRMKREGYVPERGIVVALTAGEEGSGVNGARWLLENRRDLVDGWFVINEGGGGQLDPEGTPVANTVQVAEKKYQSFTFRVTNPGGHSARPRRDNAIVFLSEALVAVGRHRFPVVIDDVTRTYLERSAPQFAPEIARAMRALLADPADPAANRSIEESDPRLNATLRTTCIPTLVEGGHAPNAMPQLAEATINCRLLPEHDPREVHRVLRELAGPQVEVTVRDYAPDKPTSPLDPAIFEPIERLTQEMWPGVPVVPLMGTGATDGSHFRAAGIPVYGATGLFYGDTNNHGADENIPVESFYDGLEFLYRLLKQYTAAPER